MEGEANGVAETGHGVNGSRLFSVEWWFNPEGIGKWG
jgi:hypothetical protein